MIIESIVTNIDEMPMEELSKRHKEKVYLESSDLVKRIQKGDNRPRKRNRDTIKKST